MHHTGGISGTSTVSCAKLWTIILVLGGSWLHARFEEWLEMITLINSPLETTLSQFWWGKGNIVLRQWKNKLHLFKKITYGM